MQAKHSKPNRTVLRIFSTATFLAMIASCSVSAFAGTYDLNNGDVYVDVRNGDHYVSQVTHYNDDGTREYYKDYNGSEAETDNQVTITSKGESTANIIDVKTEDENQVANITLDNVHADARNRWQSRADANWNNGGCTSAMTVNGEGTTNIELKGDNYLQGQYGGIVNETGATTSAGLEFNATDLDGKKNGKLNINDADNDGSLHAVSGTWGAGIGGILGQDSGDIVINGGKVTGEAHNSSQGAGIGGGDGGAGNVTINGGTVSGTGYVGAGIGGGVGGDGNVTIKDGSVTAKGGNVGAGIGSGGNGGTSNVTITGGVIEKAAGGMEGAGIGGGNEDDGNVTITGGTIKEATGGDFIGAAGIGGGRGGNADIKISNATIGTVTGGGGGSGIGTGSGGESSKIEIKDTTIEKATGNGGGAGIGTGMGGRSSDITLDNVTVKNAEGSGAGIGGGNAAITIKNSNVTATGSTNASGVGSSSSGNADVTIEGSTVNATGGDSGAGVGAADGGDATVSIKKSTTTGKSSTVTGKGSGGIGVGAGGNGQVTIEGGSTITAVGTNYSGISTGTDGTVTIQDSTVIKAAGGSRGSGIGTGYAGQNQGSTIKIINSKILESLGGVAGIGGGTNTNVSITEKSNVGTVTGGNAGIGSNGGNTNVTIDHSHVTSATGTAGTGIGNSAAGSTSTIKITGNSHVETVTGSVTGIGMGNNGTTDITIDGSQVDTVTGKGGSGIGGLGCEATVTINNGKITTVTGNGGAGIGSLGKATVTISGGKITTVTGKGGAGIGATSYADVTIKDAASIDTVSGEKGVGIGGAGYSTVKILGKTGIETVTGSITGIGSGNGAWADVTIEDSKLDTVTGKGGTGIGAGTGGRGGVTIKGTVLGSVTGEQGAGIGGGSLAEILFENSSVTNAIGKNGAGIGGGIAGTANITISNGKVGTARGTGAAGIGTGKGYAPSTITIKDNSVIGLAENTDTEQGSAGIGFGSGYNNGSTLTISRSEVKKAVGGAGAAGIGGGYKTGFLTIELIDSILREINGGAGADNKGGAGIGTGAYDYPTSFPTTINLRNTTVENAAGATGAAGIGGGYNTSIGVGSSDTNISISGGNVTATAGKMRGESFGSTAANAPFAIGNGELPDVDSFKTKGNVTIDGDASDTIVTAIASDLDHAISQLANITVDSLGEAHKVLVNMRDTCGTILKAIHNRAYVGYPADAEEAEAHAWDGGVIIKDATPDEYGEILYTCTVEGCGATKHGVLPKLIETREVGVIFWDAAAQAAPAALQGKVLSADEQTATAEKAQVESLLADKANWKLAEDVGDLKIHPAADAAGTVYEQAVKASGCQYYVIANVTAQ